MFLALWCNNCRLLQYVVYFKGLLSRCIVPRSPDTNCISSPTNFWTLDKYAIFELTQNAINFHSKNATRPSARFVFIWVAGIKARLKPKLIIYEICLVWKIPLLIYKNKLNEIDLTKKVRRCQSMPALKIKAPRVSYHTVNFYCFTTFLLCEKFWWYLDSTLELIPELRIYSMKIGRYNIGSHTSAVNRTKLKGHI